MEHSYIRLPETICTSSLLLRRWKWKDLKPLQQLCSEPAFASLAGFQALSGYGMALIRLVFGYMSGTGYAIVLRETDQLIGSVSLMRGAESHIVLPEQEWEAGYWIGQPYWGHGYGPEALEAVLDLFFSLRIARKIWCVVQADNHQSHRVQEKLGFRYNRSETIPGIHQGSQLLCRVFEISDQDWRCHIYERSACKSTGSGRTGTDLCSPFH